MSEFTIDDMISSVLEKRPETFKSAFNDIMAQKAIESIEARKQEIAQTMFDTPDKEQEEDPTDQDDLEIEDENVEDS